MKYLSLLLFCLSVIEKSFQVIELDFNKSGNNYQQYATRCLLNLASNIFPARTTIAFLSEKILDSPGLEVRRRLIRSMHANINWNIVIASSNVIIDHYIIFVNESKALQSYLQTVKHNPYFKLRTHKLIYFYEFVDDYKAQAEALLKILYENKHYKSSVLIPSSLTDLNLYAYDLYAKSAKYCATTPEIVQLNQCVNGSFMQDRYIPHRYPNNLNCTIKTYAIKIPPFVIDVDHGLEISILREIGEALNVTFDITILEGVEYWGNKSNGEWSGPLGIIDANQFNLGVGCVSSAQTDRLNDFEFTDNYFIERMVWILPSALREAQWKDVFIVFSYKIWLILTVTICSFGLLYAWIKKTWRIFFISIEIIVGLSVWKQPSGRIFRMMFVSEAFLALIMISLYQGKLFNVMSTARFQHQISSGEEIQQSSLNIGGIYAYSDIFNTSQDRISKIFHDYQTVPNATLTYWIARVGDERKFATVAGELYMKYLFALHSDVVMDSDGKHKIFISSDYILRETTRMVFSKGFPLQGEFNFIISGLLHSGMIHKWTNEYMHVPINQKAVKTEQKSVNMEVMIGAFMLLGIGYGLGIICLTLEILFNKNN